MIQDLLSLEKELPALGSAGKRRISVMPPSAKVHSSAQGEATKTGRDAHGFVVRRCAAQDLKGGELVVGLEEEKAVGVITHM